MTTIVRSLWGRRLRAGAGGVLGLAVMAYVLAKGITVLAGIIGPGLWGYVGAAGLLAIVGPLPLLLVGRRLGAFGHSIRLVILVGALTLAIAGLAIERHWSGWAVAAWLAALLFGWAVVRAILSLPLRLIRRRAVRLLRRQRGSAVDNAWSLRDWEWAYTQLGTPLALDQAAWCRMLRTGGPRDPEQKPT